VFSQKKAQEDTKKDSVCPELLPQGRHNKIHNNRLYLRAHEHRKVGLAAIIICELQPEVDYIKYIYTY